MPPLILKKGDKRPVSTNFTANEFYSKSSDAPASHSFPSELVEAVQFLRSHYNTPWRITSSYRTWGHEYRIFRGKGKDVEYSKRMADTSQHVKRRAVDSQPKNLSPEILHDLQQDFLSRGPIFQQLRALGVTGFGVYDRFVHLDTRPEGGKQKDALGTYAFWNNMANSPKKTKPSPTKAKTVAASVPSPSKP